MADQKSAPNEKSMVGSALKVLNSAIQSVPVTKYALGVAGVAAAAAIVRLFVGGDLNKGVLVLSVMFIFSVAMLVFAKIATLDAGGFKHPALVMLWSCVIFFVISGALSLSSVFIGKPLPWQLLPSNSKEAAAEPGICFAMMSNLAGGYERVSVEVKSSTGPPSRSDCENEVRRHCLDYFIRSFALDQSSDITKMACIAEFSPKDGPKLFQSLVFSKSANVPPGGAVTSSLPASPEAAPPLISSTSATFGSATLLRAATAPKLNPASPSKPPLSASIRQGKKFMVIFSKIKEPLADVFFPSSMFSGTYTQGGETWKVGGPLRASGTEYKWIVHEYCPKGYGCQRENLVSPVHPENNEINIWGTTFQFNNGGTVYMDKDEVGTILVP